MQGEGATTMPSRTAALMQSRVVAMIGAAVVLVIGWAVVPVLLPGHVPGNLQLVPLSSGTVARLDTRTGDVTGCALLADGWPHAWCNVSLDDAQRLARAWRNTVEGERAERR